MSRIVISAALLLSLGAFVRSDTGIQAGPLEHIDPCKCEVTASAGAIFVCPHGDGESLQEHGLVIAVTARDYFGTPAVNIPAADIWVDGCNQDLLSLCGYNGGLTATGPTDENGHTTLIGRIAGGGCSVDGIRVMIQGIAVGGICGVPCIPIKIKTPDLDGNRAVNLVDFALFGKGYTSPPKLYNECIDFTAPFGAITVTDFAKFALHRNHTC